MGRPKEDPVKRFWARCDKRGPEDCWNWMAGKFADGYGQIRVSRKPTKAHRLSWVIHNGEIPEGMFVLHRCDNKACVNPNHLFLGTAQDNMDDMKAKGRDNRTTGAAGEKSWAAKLSEADVRLIRKLKSLGTPSRELSFRFGVCVVQINAIVRKQYWSHI